MWWAREVNPICGACFASSAIRCCRVDMSPSSDALAMFPSNDSMMKAPPSLARIPSGAVLLFPGYYEVLRRPASLSPRFVCLRLPIPARAPVCVSPFGPTPAGGLELWGLAAPHQPFRTGDHRASQVPGEPRCAYALFWDPGRTATSGHTTLAAWPPYVATTRAPTM